MLSVHVGGTCTLKADDSSNRALLLSKPVEQEHHEPDAGGGQLVRTADRREPSAADRVVTQKRLHVKLQLHLLRADEDRRPMVSSKSGIGERRDSEQTLLFHAGSVRAICSLRSGANKREQTDYRG